MQLDKHSLGEICDKVGGIIRTGPFGSQLHESDYKEEGIPVVMPKNIVDGKISIDGIARISKDDVARLAQHKLCKGDIVYGRRGDIGRRALVTARESGWLCGTGCLRISLGNTLLDPLFLYYFLGQPKVIEWIFNQAIGATLPNLNTEIIRSIQILYPSLPTQRKIAAILSAYDDLIENNTRRIAILEEMAQSLYREWFVHFRFPGHEKKRLVESELGLIPERWEVRQLSEVCSRITDGSHWSPKTVGFGYPMASVKDMHDWGFNIEQCRTIAKEDYETLVRNNCKPLIGDVLIAKDGSYLKHIFVVQKELDIVILSSIAILRLNNKVLPYVLSLYLREPSIKSRLSSFVSGVAIPRIVLKDFAKFLIILPPRDIQEQFCRLAEPMIMNCYRLIEKNANLRQTRDLLLPKLISGEVDVEGLDIHIEGGIYESSREPIPSIS